MVRPGMLERGRAMAESLMTLTVSASAPGVAGQIRPGDLRRTESRLDRGTSRAKVQSAGRQPQGRTVEVGGAERLVMEGGLHLPLNSYLDDDGQLLIRRGWEFVVTAVGPEDDRALLHQRYYVVEVLKKSRLTARRLDVVEV